jgi:hypothetical protein
VAVSSVQLGQLWQFQETGDKWLVTKIYSEVFASYAVLRKVGSTDSDVRRVKVEKTAEGVFLQGYAFTQESEAF